MSRNQDIPQKELSAIGGYLKQTIHEAKKESDVNVNTTLPVYHHSGPTLLPANGFTRVEEPMHALSQMNMDDAQNIDPHISHMTSLEKLPSNMKHSKQHRLNEQEIRVSGHSTITNIGSRPFLNEQHAQETVEFLRNDVRSTHNVEPSPPVSTSTNCSNQMLTNQPLYTQAPERNYFHPQMHRSFPEVRDIPQRGLSALDSNYLYQMDECRLRSEIVGTTDIRPTQPTGQEQQRNLYNDPVPNLGNKGVQHIYANTTMPDINNESSRHVNPSEMQRQRMSQTYGIVPSPHTIRPNTNRNLNSMSLNGIPTDRYPEVLYTPQHQRSYDSHKRSHSPNISIPVQNLQDDSIDGWIDLLPITEHAQDTDHVSGIPAYAVANRWLMNQSLPTISIPKFNGNELKWVDFVTHFKEMVHEQPYLTTAQRMAYLLQYLEGDAKRSIAGFGKGWFDYRRALKRLKYMFGDRARIAQAYLNKVTKGKAVKENDIQGLTELYYEVSDCLSILSRLHYEADLRSTDVLLRVLKRLPPRLLTKWKEYSYRLRRKEEPSLIHLEAWLEDRVMAARDPYAPVSEDRNTQLCSTSLQGAP